MNFKLQFKGLSQAETSSQGLNALKRLETEISYLPCSRLFSGMIGLFSCLWTSHQNRRMMYSVIILLFFVCYPCLAVLSPYLTKKVAVFNGTCTHFSFLSGSLPYLSFCMQLIPYLYIIYLMQMHIFIPLN